MNSWLGGVTVVAFGMKSDIVINQKVVTRTLELPSLIILMLLTFQLPRLPHLDWLQEYGTVGYRQPYVLLSIISRVNASRGDGIHHWVLETASGHLCSCKLSVRSHTKINESYGLGQSL